MTDDRTPRDLYARDVMTTDVLTAQPDWTLDKLASFLTANAISGAPVTDDEGHLLGVVSMSDIAQHSSMPEEMGPRSQSHKEYHLALDAEYSEEELESFRTQAWSTVTVDELMTPMVFDVNEDAPIQQVADTMIRGRIHRVLVTRDSDLVGIITALDLLEVVRDL